MAQRKKPQRAWEIDDLLELGNRQGENGRYLKSVPVLILEKWVKGGRVDGKANYIYTKQLRSRLETSKLHDRFVPKATGGIIGSLTSTQNSRNLTDPELLEKEADGLFKFNLRFYEPLLQEYRQKYYELYPKDYKKLFPEGEPEWESENRLKTQKDTREVDAKLVATEVDDQVKNLIEQLEQVLLRQQQDIRTLKEEHQKLQVRQDEEKKKTPEVSFVHTSPDFHRSKYDRKITSIKDTIADMLKRAEHSIRISTRQMDMFTDDLIALKRRNPELEITVLSRGPQGAEGDRKKLAGVAFERMKQAGIKLPVERDSLHSRLVIIDSKEVLVSSADLDFTQMDLEFNAGIWTNNPDTVAEAIQYFDNLLGLSQVG